MFCCVVRFVGVSLLDNITTSKKAVADPLENICCFVGRFLLYNCYQFPLADPMSRWYVLKRFCIADNMMYMGMVKQ